MYKLVRIKIASKEQNGASPAKVDFQDWQLHLSE